MRIAMVGTHGVPARYGGFETAVEQVGSRLAAAGHEVVVYCRGADAAESYRGMRRVRLPALSYPHTETLSHSALSIGHLIRHPADVVIVFNSANAPLLPVLRALRMPVAVHVDGFDWERGRWGPAGRRYYLACQRMAVRLADALIADAAAVQDHYRLVYKTHPVLLTYGAPILAAPKPHHLAERGLSLGGYHLAVARFVPENHLDVIVQGFRRSAVPHPLVVVGGASYPSEHDRHIKQLADPDPRIQLVGAVWDQDALDSLYAGAAGYVHGHSVGGTNPSLLRAMGAGTPITAWDVTFNREVLGGTGCFFESAQSLADQIDGDVGNPDEAAARGRAARERAAERYRWDDVARGYEQLCRQLQAGRHGFGRRRRDSNPTKVL